MGNQSINQILLDIHQRLLTCYGPQGWWPAKRPFEVIVGAILTQSAAWHNVEKAIANLRSARALSPQVIRSLPVVELASLVRPCGYYNTKAQKLKAFAYWLGNHYTDDLNRLFATTISNLRDQLLSIHGIGQETADSIMLYAAGKPIFVIDAYTRRILGRIGLAPGRDSYTAYQEFFMSNLPADARLYNEYHALLVCLAKDTCRRHPRCQQCCLGDVCAADAGGASFRLRVT